jgi:hypothetical protein
MLNLIKTDLIITGESDIFVPLFNTGVDLSVIFFALGIRPSAIEAPQPASYTAAEFILFHGDGLHVSPGRAQVLVIQRVLRLDHAD